MFENIISYSQLTTHLNTLLVQGTLPSTLLISGRGVSGKQTIAAELARGILCNKSGDWSCSCDQCSHSRMLTHQDILLMGHSNAIKEIFCGRNMVLAHKEKREVWFFLRAVSKLLRRADELIWEGSDAWNKGIRKSSETLRELLVEYQESESKWYVQTQINKVLVAAQKLHLAFPAHMYPVQCIRNVVGWTMIRSRARAKIIIMNKVEDMSASAANMMLKILEEPPERVYFILLSNNPFSIISTIKSRVREYELKERSREEEQEILSQVFKYDNHKNVPINSLQEYLDSAMEDKKTTEGDKTQVDNASQGMQKNAEMFMNAILATQDFDEEIIAFANGKQKNFRENSLIFLSYLTTHIRKVLDDQSVNAQYIRNIWQACEVSRTDIQQKNMSASLVLEVLYYKMLELYGKTISRF